jgi:hypothetical protein
VPRDPTVQACQPTLVFLYKDLFTRIIKKLANLIRIEKQINLIKRTRPRINCLTIRALTSKALYKPL